MACFAEDDMKEFKIVPLEYQTDINLVPFEKKSESDLKDSVSIGTIGPEFVVLHGVRLDIDVVQVGTDPSKSFIQIITKATKAGVWTFIISQDKPKGKTNKWCLFITSYIPPDFDFKTDVPSSEVYSIILGKHPSVERK